MNFSESEIQKYIWSRRADIHNLLDLENLPQKIEINADLSNVNAETLSWNRIVSHIDEACKKVLNINLTGVEVPLEQEGNSTIRADFLSTFTGNTGIGIIELKKSSQTERQAFTELLAYSNHLTNIFPSLTRGDIVYILIAPFKTRICRDALIHSLLFDNRTIVGLIPVFTDPSSLSSLKLRLWVPEEKELVEISSIAFCEQNFSVCKIAWEHSEGWWDPEIGNNPTPHQIQQLNEVSSIAAQHMESSGIHGFTYTSQLWSELSTQLPFTNSLILVGMNPFSVGRLQYLAQISEEDAPDFQDGFPNITMLIPGLLRSFQNTNRETYHLSDLELLWVSQLFDIGKKVVELVTLTTTGNSLEIEYNFFNWEDYQTIILEDISCHNFNVKTTGIVRDFYHESIAIDYRFAGEYGLENHPIHGDMYFNAIEAIVSQINFREFILRLLGQEEDLI